MSNPNTPENTPSHFIESVHLHKRERRIRVDVLYYTDRIVRKLKVSSQRMRDYLNMPRVTRLPDLSPTMSREQIQHECRQALRQVLQSATNGRANKRQSGFLPVGQQNTGALPQKTNIPDGYSLSGLLVAAGYQKKPGRDGKEGFEQYCIDVMVAGKTRPERVWGADLRRALTDANARIGDSIEVRSLGMTSFTKNSKSVQENGTEVIEPKVVQMKAYEITKRGPSGPEAA